MPDIEIVKLKIRRGPDSQRKLVTLEQGELGYTTDFKRVFVGDGITVGGAVIGNKIHPQTGSRINIASAITNDLVYDNNKLYQLTGSDPTNNGNWSFVGTVPDATFLEYDSSDELTLAYRGITIDKINPNIVDVNGCVDYDSLSGFSVNVDSQTIVKDSNSLKVQTIDEEHINSTALGNGLAGGSGTTITVDANTSQFGFVGNSLTLETLPNGIVDVPALSAGSLGDGLKITPGNKLDTVVQGGDTSTITLDIFSGQLSLAAVGGGSLNTFGTLTYDQYGRVTNTESSLQQPLCAEETTSSPLSVFNGAIDQTTYTDQTIIPTLSSNGVSTATVNLTSAGFMQVETSLGKLAIPVFLPPQ